MGRYYYFATTLPTPQLGAPAPMTSAELLERCRRHLSPQDYRIVEAASLASALESAPAASTGSSLLRRYYGWERSLRNELVRLRARRLERPLDQWARPAERDEMATRAAQAAFAAPSPLEAEVLLERQRWETIEGLKALHFFDLESIAAYRLELQILERLARLREELGQERYREIYAAILGGTESTEESARESTESGVHQ